jgi:Zn-finger nucleic acid-binding protein
MIHLSLSFESRPLCGTHESAMVATQTPIEELDVCPTCLSVWNGSDVRYHLEPIRTGYHVWVTVNGLTVATETFHNADYKHPCRSAQQWLRENGAKR